MKNKIIQTFLVLSLNTTDNTISRGNRFLSAMALLWCLGFFFLNMPMASVSMLFIAWIVLIIPFDF